VISLIKNYACRHNNNNYYSCPVFFVFFVPVYCLTTSNAQFEHQVWYADSGANACITSNAQNITHLLPFNGEETITVENDTCLLIKSIEFASSQIDQSDFQPSNILHCPYAFYKLTFYQ
jgi:hypothetical protein